jgi:hypothetical protein
MQYHGSESGLFTGHHQVFLQRAAAAQLNVRNIIMKKITVIISLVFTFFVSVGICHAEIGSYAVSSNFKAGFPGTPVFEGEFGEGKQKIRNYSYSDEKNIIIYNANYQVGSFNFNKNDINEALSNYIKGQALSVNGEIIKSTLETINGKQGATYKIKYKYNNMQLNKYGAVIFYSGHFYQWAVQEIEKISKKSANDIFIQNHCCPVN